MAVRCPQQPLPRRDVGWRKGQKLSSFHAQAQESKQGKGVYHWSARHKKRSEEGRQEFSEKEKSHFKWDGQRNPHLKPPVYDRKNTHIRIYIYICV